MNSWQIFLDTCVALAAEAETLPLFELFFTPEEKEDIGRRVLIVKELLRGEKTQRQIAADHQVSIAKITRGSNLLKGLSPELMDKLREQLL